MGYEHSLTSKSQVTVPKDVRLALGLVPGGRVRFDIGDDGTVTLARADEAAERRARGDRARAALEAITGKYPNPDGMTTNEYMRWLRGDWEP